MGSCSEHQFNKWNKANCTWEAIKGERELCDYKLSLTDC